ncbi:MAG: transglutaminase-like domain-containing protein [Isosphaeraceae bacterium]
MTRRHPRSNRAWSLSSLAVVVLLGFQGGVARAQESWDAIYLGGAKIGYIHVFVEPVKDRGQDYFRVRIDIEQRLKRRNDVAITRLMYGTIETLDGQVLKLDTRTQAGGNQDIRAHGNVIKGQMKLILDGGGEEQSVTIPWGPDVRGPYAPEQSMARSPMKPNEERTLKMFMPGLNKVCEVHLLAREIEPVLLGDGSQRPLLRVDQTTVVDGKRAPEYDSRLYVDASGQALKSEQDVLGGIVMYRTTEKGAKAPSGPVQFDLIRETVVKVSRKIPNPEQTRHVKYRITLKDSDPAELIPNDSRQAVVPDGSKTSAALEIKSLSPLDGSPSAEDPDPRYLKPNAIVTSEDTRVRSLALRLTRGVVAPWDKATRINHWVFENIRDKNFEVAFAPAGDVARTLAGDCTEHAVLAAAMCRAVGIPSRVVVGLIYVDQLDGFGFHMWDEVFVNHRWVALDPSWDQTNVDAVHIKISESSLDGVSPFEAFLPLVRVMGRLGIEPIELR